MESWLWFESMINGNPSWLTFGLSHRGIPTVLAILVKLTTSPWNIAIYHRVSPCDWKPLLAGTWDFELPIRKSQLPLLLRDGREDVSQKTLCRLVFFVILNPVIYM